MAAIVDVHVQGPVRRNVKGATPWFYPEVEVPQTRCPVPLNRFCQWLLVCRRSLILFHDEETTNRPAVSSECP